MCVSSAVVFVVVAGAIVVASPVHPYLRGPHYTVDGAPHRQPYLEVRNATYHGAGPREEARAMCSVKTQEVNATANATITRRLHGVVTSRELHSAIARLEVIIFGQMQQLWQSLDALRTQLSGNNGHSYSGLSGTKVHSYPGLGNVQGYPDRRTVSFRFQPDAG
ncbi:hypothetical protein JYU34_011430 [Plutella xylostella]|uniref:Uncharacterized protein n=1 Tax=Plutella xylostella TaxID=51655 RepID=A0ABQ7QI75_PLUXY|nr:hypothetical protein JYU34_011430 [Plutella xylostella]